MRITLVQPPSNYEETFLLSPPLGLLSIASAAENEGAKVSLLDFNLKGLQDKKWQTAEYFYANAVDLIEQQNPDVVGFTSMAIESHVCLETARLLKEKNPSIITVFGGPHFGAIATEALEHYDWVDYVISGEGEAPLQNLIRYLEGNGQVATMENIAYRKEDQIIFDKQSKAGRDLDEIPFPAYHIVNMEEYFELNPNRLVCFEHARGCFLKCSFCYSPQHWGHGESRKSLERIVAELKQLEDMGIKELFWVSDNLLNSKDHAIKVSEAIIEAELEFKWHCYGTIPQIAEDLVDALSKAGCASIFVGVDAVAEDTKKRYQKSYFKSWGKLHGTLMMCLSKGITPTCAFMLSPHDSEETLETTLRVAGLCAMLGCFVRLNALTNYNGTKIEDELEEMAPEVYSESYSTVLFDTAELLIQNNYAKERPKLFPFHRCFAIPEVHEFFAGFCRLAMRIVNSNKALVSIAPQEYDFSLFRTIGSLRMQFSINEIDCRNINNTKTNTVFYLGLMQEAAKADLPRDLIKLDKLMLGNSQGPNSQIVEFKVDETYVSCQCPEFVIIKTNLDVYTGVMDELVEPKFYFFAVVDNRFVKMEVLTESKYKFDSKEQQIGNALDTRDYIQLVSQRILTPLA